AGMVGFLNDPAFINKHEIPLPLQNFKPMGENISFDTPDGGKGYGYLIKAAKGKSNKYLLVFHEWWGLNDYVRKESDKFYADLGEDVNVLAIDLYDQKVAATREEAGAAMKGLSPERAVAIVKGAMQLAGEGATFGTVGWCMGGGWSLQASLLAGAQAKACIIYYGMPEKDLEKLKTLQAPVLGIFAAQEKWIGPEVVAEFDKNLTDLGKTHTIKSFDADHAFANPSNPKYDSAATEEAYAMSLAFLKENL
ncbi:MAG TPA: dienelactone hydrolase, partial [Microscillaceae bacterium]|nr:dienelactone hydrolase [Microscillaceae bacterium]